MRVSNLILKNFKTFKEECVLDDLRKFTIIIGSNNVGKSNIFKSLELLNKLSRNDPPQSFSTYIFDRGNENFTISVTLRLTIDERKKIISVAQISKNKFTIDLQNNVIFDTVKYELELNSSSRVSEKLWINNNQNQLIQILEGKIKGGYGLDQLDLDQIINQSGLDFSDLSFSSFHGVQGQITILAGINGMMEQKIADMVREYFRNIVLVPAQRNLGGALPASETHEFNFKTGNASQVLNTQLQNDPDEFVKITTELKKCLPEIEKITSPLSGNSVTIKISEPTMNTPTMIDDFSDGLKQSIGLFLLNKTTQNNVLLCIEEPEINLHTDTQKKLFKLLRENSKDIQFFLTTHSPTFVAIGEDAKTFLLTKHDGKAQAQEITHKDDLKFIKQELGIKNSDIFGYDGILFVEGYSEEEAAKIISPALGYDELGSSIRLVNLEGSGMVTRLKPFLEYLKGGDSKLFLIIDSHKEIFRELPKFIESGLLTNGHSMIWDQNFEDTFGSKELIIAMTNLSRRNNYKFSLTIEDLEKDRKDKGVYALISKNFFDLNNRQLKKPELSKELAYVIVNDILNNKDHVETMFEKTLRQAMDFLIHGKKLNNKKPELAQKKYNSNDFEPDVELKISKSGGIPQGGQFQINLAAQFELEVESQTLFFEYFVPVSIEPHCSDVKLHIFLDDIKLGETDWLGYKDRQDGLPLKTGVIAIENISPGKRMLKLIPEGRKGGCNEGYIAAWGGTIITYL